MADIENGTQFSDLPSCLVRDILRRLPIKTLLICRYHVRKDWTQLYFSDQDSTGRHHETSNILYLDRILVERRKFRLGWFVDEVSTGNLRMETLDFSCKLLHDPEYYWRVVNSCNGLVCLIDGEDAPYRTPTCSRIYVCNPILGELVSIPYPKRDCSYSYSQCALGFSAENNQYKILLCIGNSERNKYRWGIYTLGTRRGWRSIETEENLAPWSDQGLDFNTFIHGSLHWTRYRNENCSGGLVVQSFDFETERFTVLSLPKVRRYVNNMDVTLGVINGRLWASFFDMSRNASGEMWAMKEYGVDKSWTRMLAIRDFCRRLLAGNKELVLYKEEVIGHHRLVFTLNGDEMLTWNRLSHFVCYNIEKPRRRFVHGRSSDFDCGIAYNPSFVSLGYVAKGEQIVS